MQGLSIGWWTRSCHATLLSRDVGDFKTMYPIVAWTFRATGLVSDSGASSDQDPEYQDTSPDIEPYRVFLLWIKSKLRLGNM